MLKQRTADKAFSRLQYAEASILYEELMKTENSGPENKSKLAMCYYKMNDTRRAENIYQILYQSNVKDTLILYAYADVLAKNGKYSESKVIYKEYLDGKSDQRAVSQLKSIEKINSFYTDSSKFKIYYLKNNSPEADFSPAHYKKGIVFSSARLQSEVTRRIYGWDNSAFLDLYYADTTGLDTLRFKTSIGVDQTDTTTYSDIENKGRLHPDIATKTSNDTRRLGYHIAFSHPDSIWSKYDTMHISVPFNKVVNTKYHEGPSCFVGDTIIYFTRNNYNGWKAKKSDDKLTNLNIYVSYFKRGNWTKAELLPFCNKNYSVGHPAMSNNGKTMYFASNMPGGKGKTDIYRSTLSDGKWSTPENIGSPVNTSGNEFFPFIDSLNTLYFASDGHGGLGGLDIFRADISGKTQTEVKNMGYPVNSRKDDFGLIISNDSKFGFFSSNRKRGISDDDIYFFTQQTFKPFQLRVIVKSAEDSSLITGASVILREKISGNIRKDSVSDNVAAFAYTFLKPADKTFAYKVNVSKSGFYPDSLSFPSYLFSRADGQSIDTVIYVKKIKYFVYCGLVLEKKSKKPVENPTVYLLNLKTKALDTVHTDVNGRFCRNLESNTSYIVKAEKENYFPDCYKITVPVIKTICRAQSDYLLSLTKIGVNTTFEVKNLLYDYNQASVRPDAALILDNLVTEVLIAYPTIKVELGAHTDSRGNDGYNQKLSQRRADSAVAYVLKNGISTMRITSKGYGESKTMNKCKNGVKCSEEEHQANRRTEIRVTGFLKPSEYEAAGIKGLMQEGHKFDINSSHNECQEVELKLIPEL